MKKAIVLFFALCGLISCNKEQEKENQGVVVTENDTLKDSKFQMYEMSEMATLMEQMYAYNMQLKIRIENQDVLGEYPSFFEKLHKAELTEPSDRDAFFNQQALAFTQAQRAIYQDPKTAKEQFNKMVNQCLECHAKKCGGPIPRIKKLIIP